MLHSKLVMTQTSWSFSGARTPARATCSPVIGSVGRNSFLAGSAVNLRRRGLALPRGGVRGTAIRCPSFLLERLQGLHGVDQGRSSLDDGRDVDRLGHLFPGGPRGRGSLGVDVDAGRALDRVRDREGGQFPRLLSQRA